MRRCRLLRAGFAFALCIGLSACSATSDSPSLWAVSSSTGSQKDAPPRPASDRRSSPIGHAPAETAAQAEVMDRGSGQFMNMPVQTASVGGATNGDSVNVNLLNVPIAQAAKAILGDILRLNYVVSDKVTGTVTIQSTTPMPKDALTDVFEAALKANGAVIVRSAGFYKVVPAASVAGTGMTIGAQNRRSEPGIEVQALTLQFVSAAEMKRVIEPIAVQGAVLRVDDARNMLVVSGTSRELKDISSLVALFDVDWMRGMSFGMIPVKSANPEVIAKELETIYGLDKDGPLKGVIRFVPNRRLSSVLIISSKPVHLEKARDWIARLDNQAQKSEPQLYVYKIQNRPATELAALLQKTLGLQGQDAQIGTVVAPRFDQTAVTTSAPVAAIAGVNGVISSALSPAATPALERGTSDASPAAVAATRITADEGNNALIIQALPKDYDRILGILMQLDGLPLQVMLEAVIAEVTLNDELKFGIKWNLQKGKSSGAFTNSAAGAVASTFPGFSYFLSLTNIQVALDALSSVTKVNVVSAPSLTVLDNHKATLQVGDQVPISTQSSQSVQGAGAPIVNTVQMKDTGVILNVTPRVSDAGRVVLDIEQEVSSVAKTSSSGIDSPTIQQRKVKTTVIVQDGEVLALGGLIQESNTSTKSKVPLLGDLPGVGPLFRNNDNAIVRTELVIFIRPRVMHDTGEARQITEEFRSRIRLQAPLTRREPDAFRRDIRRIVE